MLDNPSFIEATRLGTFPAPGLSGRPRGTEVSVVLDLMIHDIDIVLGLIKQEVVNIEAVGLSTMSDFEDVANVRLTFEDGTIADITASRVTKDVVRKIRIFQEESYISLDYLNQEVTIFKKTGNKILKEKLPTCLRLYHNISLKNEIICFNCKNNFKRSRKFNINHLSEYLCVLFFLIMSPL
jgi:predicted dehydrogenase